MLTMTSGRTTRMATVKAGIALAFAIGATLAAAGCDGGGSPRAAMINVVNGTHSDATIAWQSDGPLGLPFFGSSGTDPIAGCGSYGRSFGPGRTSVAISENGRSLTVVMEGSDENPVAKAVLISGNGEVVEVEPGALPSVPCG